MTTSSGTTSASVEVHQLWQRISQELVHIFDAHFVCATAASEIAVHTGVTTVVAVSDPQRQYFDVWICDRDGNLRQKRWDKKTASFEPFLEAQQVVRLEKFGRPAAEQVSSELWLLPRDDILGIALPYPAHSNAITPPGVLCLIDPQDNCCLNAETLAQFAGNVTVYLDRAYLRHQVDRQEVEFAVISDISHTLTATLSLENVFQQLSGTIRRTLNVQSLSVGLTEEVTGDIVFVESLMGPLFKALPAVRLKRGQGIAGWVAEHREPVIINDAYTDQRFYRTIDQRSGFQTRSMICIPLQVEERTIGVLQAINRQHGKFTQHDLRLLQAIGGPLAAAIENARLHMDVLSEKRRIETIFSSMSEGVVTVNANGIITQANDAIGALLVANPVEMIGQYVYDVVRLKESSLKPFIQQVTAAKDEYPQLATDLQQSNADFLAVLISGAPIAQEDGTISELILVFSDLRQIREVERMRDDFFHGIVHELRTPLATILMYARLLREGKAQDAAKAARFLGVIERESDRLQKMVRQMLQLAKQDVRELQRSWEAVALNSLFEEILPPLADQAIEKGLVFRQRIEPNLPPVMGNPETMHLIFKNLLDNAIKFTPSGAVRVTARLENGMLHVEISDEGIGIPRQSLPNMFKRFYRTQTAVERGIAGTGLGLYMVKESVENYNGSITVESTEGKGSTFTVRLPVAEV
jgi:two-component system, OmpR family, phosphate regulon sensor histidine kinase PhoR